MSPAPMKRPTSSQVSTFAAIAAAMLFAGGIVAGVVSAIEENLGATLLSMLLWLLALVCGVVWLFAYIASRRAPKPDRTHGFDVIQKP